MSDYQSNIFYISVQEWVLNGDTVLYSNYDMLRETLEYDFEQEKKTDYSVLNADMAVLPLKGSLVHLVRND